MSVSEIPGCIHALRAEVCVVELAEGEVPIKSDIRILFCACDMCAYVVLLEKRYI